MAKNKQFLKVDYDLLGLKGSYIHEEKRIIIDGDKICLLVLLSNLSKKIPCIADNHYLSQTLHVSVSTIGNWIRDLKKIGFITVSEERRRGTKSTTVRTIVVNQTFIEDQIEDNLSQDLKKPIPNNKDSTLQTNDKDSSKSQ